MTPSFSRAIDPLFLHVLRLLERIERNEPLDAGEQRVLIRAWLDNAEATFGQSDQWQLAKFALVAWIDEVLIETAWEGQQWWQENALEVEMFNTRDAYTAFYAKARDASQLTKKDALEVFYVCAVLGFRGLYRDSKAADQAKLLNLPTDLQTWAKQAAMAIHLGQGRAPIDVSGSPGRGAPPLDGRFQLVGTSLLTVVLAAATIIVGWALFIL